MSIKMVGTGAQSKTAKSMTGKSKVISTKPWPTFKAGGKKMFGKQSVKAAKAR
jgi:hypothetical protein